LNLVFGQVTAEEEELDVAMKRFLVVHSSACDGLKAE
jgi:hypothetical protein